MREEIRELIKESLYDSMERDLTLPSGKVLPNFRGIVIALTSNTESAKQAFSIIEMIDEYSLMDTHKEYISNRVGRISPISSIVRLYFIDKEVADALYTAISNHPNIITDGIELMPMDSSIFGKWHCVSFYINETI